MFPSIRQRVVMGGGVVAAAWLYASIEPVARAGDGRDGLTMMLAAKPALAMGAFALVTLAASLIGGLAGAWGNPLAGVFTLAAGLAWAAARGGTIDPWLRSAPSSDIYLRLAGDAMMWLALIAIATELCIALGEKMQRFVPIAERPDPEQTRQEIESLRAQLRQRGAWWALLAGEVVTQGGRVTRRGPPAVQHVLGLVLAVAIGSAASMLVLQATDPWQVIWGLAIAYGVATAASHQLFPECHFTALLLSPLVAAILWNLFISAAGGDHEALLSSYFTGGFWRPGLALPIYYASAGVAGAAAGIGASQLIWHGRIEQKKDGKTTGGEGQKG